MYNKIRFSAFVAGMLCFMNSFPLLGKSNPEVGSLNPQSQSQQVQAHPTDVNTQSLSNQNESGQTDTNHGAIQPEMTQTQIRERQARVPEIQHKSVPEIQAPHGPTQHTSKMILKPTMDPKMKQALLTSEGETIIPIGKDKVTPFLQSIKQRGRLIVAMYSVDQPPFFMKDKDGKLIGLDVEIATKMAEVLGVTVEFNRDAASFNEVVDIVSSGKADIGISKLSFTLVRSQKVLYTKPYIVLGKTFLINRLEMAKLNTTKKADTLNGLFNQNGRTIGVIKDSSYESFARQLFPNATIVPLGSWGPQTLDMAVDGKVLGVFRDDLEIKKLIRQKPDSNLRVLPVTLKNQEDPIRIIVPWNQDHFVNWVNEFLQSLEISLTVDELLTKYNSYFEQMENDFHKVENAAKIAKLAESPVDLKTPPKPDSKSPATAPSQTTQKKS